MEKFFLQSKSKNLLWVPYNNRSSSSNHQLEMNRNSLPSEWTLSRQIKSTAFSHCEISTCKREKSLWPINSCTRLFDLKKKKLFRHTTSALFFFHFHYPVFDVHTTATGLFEHHSNEHQVHKIQCACNAWLKGKKETRFWLRNDTRKPFMRQYSISTKKGR